MRFYQRALKTTYGKIGGKTMDNSDVSHEGHRKRLLDTVVKAGLENLSEIQQVEFMLTYIFPRGDVNPLAHRLLDAYGSIGGIIDASDTELMTIRGINERSAKKISMLGDLFFAYTSSRMSEHEVYEKESDILDLVELLLRFRTKENMIILGFSPAQMLCGSKRIVSNEVDSVNINILDFTAFISSCKPTSLVVAHNHPFGVANPSNHDANAREIIKNICFNCGINLIDTYIVGENGVYSQKYNELRRKYCDVDNLVNFITNN